MEFLKKRPGIHEDHLVGLEWWRGHDDLVSKHCRKWPICMSGTEETCSVRDTELVGLPRADGLILVDAHPGNPVQRLRSLNLCNY